MPHSSPQPPLRSLLALSTLVCLPSGAQAADSTFGAALQAFAGLGIVLVLIAGAAYLLRRVTPGRFGASGLLKPVATLAVGTRERIVVVEMKDTWLVLGVTSSSISTLHTMTKETLPDAPAAGDSATSRFAAILSRARGAHR
jgi:flagellar protein FliO/FliZ